MESLRKNAIKLSEEGEAKGVGEKKLREHEENCRETEETNVQERERGSE